MLNLEHGMNPETQEVYCKITSELISKYLTNLAGMLKMSPNDLKGIQLKRDGINKVLVTFPSPDDDTMQARQDAVTKFSNFMIVLRDFINSALKKELKSTEFIPLTGYPVSKLKSEILNAIAAKRHLMIINTYLEYQEMMSEDNETGYSFEGARLENGTYEFGQAALLIRNGKMSELKKLTAPLFKKIEWC